MLGLVAQRGLIAEQFQYQQKNDELVVNLTLAVEQAHAVDLIASKIHGFIGVRHVEIIPEKWSGST